ncbi:MAG TPA: hypothetical protein VF826_06255 [Chloroflexia bacterium]|jgi:hypothetical protein
MNDVYFACRTCKTYQESGYRWCYATLEEPGIDERGGPLHVDAVLNTTEYWHGAEKEEWLRELLPKVRSFLSKHRYHDLTYGDGDEIGITPTHEHDWDYLDWMNEDETPSFDLKPRDFVQKLGLRDWQHVKNYVSNLEQKPVWWYESADRVRAKKKFESLLAE